MQTPAIYQLVNDIDKVIHDIVLSDRAKVDRINKLLAGNRHLVPRIPDRWTVRGCG